MEENFSKHLSIYLKKSIVKTNTIVNKTNHENLSIKKLKSENVTLQVFYKPITRTLNIETDVP